MSRADRRGFVYSLEPIQRQREWHVEASLSKQRAILAQLSRLKKSRDQLDGDIADLARTACEGTQVDPVAHLRLLNYLSKLHDRRAGLAKQVEQMKAELKRSSDAVHACQRKLEAIEEHRESECAELGVARSRLLQIQADDEWIMRKGKPSGT